MFQNLISLHADFIHNYHLKPTYPSAHNPVDFTGTSHSVTFVGPLRDAVRNRNCKFFLIANQLNHVAERQLKSIGDYESAHTTHETLRFNSDDVQDELRTLKLRGHSVRAWRKCLNYKNHAKIHMLICRRAEMAARMKREAV